MIATNYSNLRENLKDYMDRVTDDYETLVVTRKKDRNVVMLSEEAYSNMIENLYIMGNHEYYAELLKSKRQLEEGKTVSKTMEDLRAMEGEDGE